MSKTDWRIKASNEVLLERALMLKNIRAFFDAADVLEVETPLLSHASTSDVHLDSLQSSFRDQVCYLNTSPEYAMKRLLACWNRPVYQVCKAFRDDELGVYHNPEFTMLEWYRPGYDMFQLIDEMQMLISYLYCNSRHGALKKVNFKRLTYKQMFEDITGINPHDTTPEECLQLAVSNDIEIPQGLDVDDKVDDWLDWLLTQWVLPALEKDVFIFVYDYPESQCALAKIEKNQQGLPVAKRFELFFGELELANGFDELTDADEQLLRFQQENVIRASLGKKAGKIDENFVAALRSGLPECSGVALGLDRVLMLLTESKHIAQVLAMTWSNS